MQRKYHELLSSAGLDACVALCESSTIEASHFLVDLPSSLFVKCSQEPLSHVGAMQPPQLKLALEQFSQWLSTLDVVRSQRFSALSDQRLHHRIHTSALRRLANAYESLCTQVKEPKNGYEGASTLLNGQRPFGVKAVLLQVLGLESDNDAT